MKNFQQKRIKAILATLFLSVISPFTYASCQSDVSEMNYQIYLHGSIRSFDGHQFSYISQSIDHGDGTCGADGYFNGQTGPFCIVLWEQGVWKTTLSC